jgi:hypothetical protein
MHRIVTSGAAADDGSLELSIVSREAELQLQQSLIRLLALIIESFFHGLLEFLISSRETMIKCSDGNFAHWLGSS